VAKHYTATKSRSQGREGWTVIFRHPIRLDTAGKPGRRVRRGLGTADEAQADALVEQLNEILRRPELWERAARDGLTARFDERVLDIFYDGVEPSSHDPETFRDQVLPLPGETDGYRSVLMLGTTGAGKTTLVRQILGTDPDTERFPSTSTAKTTIADTELVLETGTLFRAVVTFVSRDEVIDYLTECVSEAALAILRGAPEAEQRRRLLDHPNQRFRFSYVLGRFAGGETDDDDDTDEDIDTLTEDLIDLNATDEEIKLALSSLRELVDAYRDQVRELATEEGDERVLEELMEEMLDSELRGDERFHGVVDRLFDEIEKRFELLTHGKVTKNRQGWPVSWTWETESRADLVKAVTRFSSNHASLFGTLLTPLVNGIRVAGPFAPAWGDSKSPRLVVIDGEGLGHTPSSAAALSTGISKRIEVVDAVLLVDNAAQPMQAAPVAAMKAVVTSGNASKLVVTFTHFDMVKGDNIPSVQDRQTHVKASLDNTLKAIGEDLGPFAERSLRQRIERACFFVGGIDRRLTPAKKADRRTIEQINLLLQTIDHIADGIETTETRPVYDRINLVLAVREAAAAFQLRWTGLLGIDYAPGHPKEHWTRIKALTRRFAAGSDDEYDTLKPVGELKRELDGQIYRMLQQPVRWEGPEPTDDDKQAIIAILAKEISKKVTVLCSRRVNADHVKEWQHAYAEFGTGSTFRRARIIHNEIYDRAAPVPAVTPSLDQNRFLHEVTAVVDAVTNDIGVKLL
jgi:signal recognition particle receptor subunit beta